MKSSYHRLARVVFTSLLLAVTNLLSAAENPATGHEPPEVKVQRRVKILTEALRLNHEQQVAITDILRDRWSQERSAKQNSANGTADPIVIRRIRDAANDKIASLLSTEQRKIYNHGNIPNIAQDKDGS